MSFAGKYERVSHENFDEFLTAVEVNDVWKKQALNSTPIMEVQLDRSVSLKYEWIGSNPVTDPILIFRRRLNVYLLSI